MGDTVIAQWNDAAERFAEDQERSEYANVNKAVVKARFKRLDGEKVLDLGCGCGWYTDYFRRIGGCAVGIDGAEAMIGIARKRYPETTFSVCDISRPLPFEADSFDIVFCNQVLMDIDDVGNALSQCHRVLKRGGVFYFSIVHPAFYNGVWQIDEGGRHTGKLVSSYLTPYMSENRFWGGTAHYHRPLTYYLNAAAEAGFILTHADEPKSYDGKIKNDDLPLFFFAEYRKP